MAEPRPAPMHLGDALRWFRSRYHLSQAEAGVRMGLSPSTSQRLVSMRERPPEHPDYIEPTVVELCNLEDATGVPRGTILRHAGYVAPVDGELPPGLSPTALAGIRVVIETDLAGQPAEPQRRPKRAGRTRPRDQAAEDDAAG